MNLKRKVFLRRRGVVETHVLEIGQPKRVDDYFECEWQIVPYMPIPHGMSGSDKIEALYNTLNFVGRFIKNIREQGVEIYAENPGDNCLFNFDVLS